MQEKQENQENREKKAAGRISGKLPVAKLTRDNFLIVILVGVLLLVIAWPVEEKDKKTKTQSQQWDSEADIIKVRSDTEAAGAASDAEFGLFSYTAALENSLEELLSTMDGVGKVRVMVTLEDGGVSVIEKDQSTEKSSSDEEDSAGGSRKSVSTSMREETIFDSRQGSSAGPFVKQFLAPRVEGVVVSAQGGANAKIVQNITEAIQALFGIEAHKIKIVKMIISQ